MPSTSAEAALEFVDANVLVYAEDLTAGAKRDRALELVTRLWDERRGCLSVQVLQEFFVTITRKVARPLDHESAELRVRDLGLWTCFSPSAGDVVAAIGLARTHQLSFWDAMIVESAAQLGAATLWTEDLQAGRRIRGVRIANPFDSRG